MARWFTRSTAWTGTLNRPPRVFVDSSVLIAAAISSTGSERALIIAGLSGRLTLYFSEEVFEETRRNLSAKYESALPALAILNEALATHTVEPRPAIVERAAGIIAAKDAPILAGAVEAGVDYLATFDRRHLLSAAHPIYDAYQITVALPSRVLDETL